MYELDHLKPIQCGESGGEGVGKERGGGVMADLESGDDVKVPFHVGAQHHGNALLADLQDLLPRPEPHLHPKQSEQKLAEGKTMPFGV